jgi:hypothetical protein
MAKLPVIKRLLAEDLKAAGAWIVKLLYPLNQFMSSVYAALDHGITFQDNMLGDIKTLSIKGSNPTTEFLWSYASAPVGCFVVAAFDTSSNPQTLTSAVTCAWSYNAGVISIDNVTGLDTSRTYNVTFCVLGG